MDFFFVVEEVEAVGVSSLFLIQNDKTDNAIMEIHKAV